MSQEQPTCVAAPAGKASCSQRLVKAGGCVVKGGWSLSIRELTGQWPWGVSVDRESRGFVMVP